MGRGAPGGTDRAKTVDIHVLGRTVAPCDLFVDLVPGFMLCTVFVILRSRVPVGGMSRYENLTWVDLPAKTECEKGKGVYKVLAHDESIYCSVRCPLVVTAKLVLSKGRLLTPPTIVRSGRGPLTGGPTLTRVPTGVEHRRVCLHNTRILGPRVETILL